MPAPQMEGVADIADAYSQGEMRVSHEQNLVLPQSRSRICRAYTAHSERLWLRRGQYRQDL